MVSTSQELAAAVSSRRAGSARSFILASRRRGVFLAGSNRKVACANTSKLRGRAHASYAVGQYLSRLGRSLSVRSRLQLLGRRLLTVTKGQGIILVNTTVDGNGHVILSASLISRTVARLAGRGKGYLTFSNRSRVLVGLASVFPIRHGTFPLRRSVGCLQFLAHSITKIRRCTRVGRAIDRRYSVLIVRSVKTR